MSKKVRPGIIKKCREYPLPENNDVSPWITDMCVLPYGRLLLADYNGQQLILLSKYYEYLSSLKLSGCPWGVARVDSDNVVVTMATASKMIHVIKVNFDTCMNVTHTIRTEFVCNGIVYCDSSLIVTCPDSASVKMLDIHGNVEWSLTKYGSRRRSTSYYFQEPKYVCANADNSRFIVSDTASDIIVSIARDGNVLNLISVPNGSPMGLSLGVNGKVFVCMNGLNSINEYSDCLTEERVCGTRTDGVKLPQALCYSPEKGELLVCSAIEKHLLTYQFRK